MSYPRPKSPNMQNYRPQLTSVMSFGHRLSGLALALLTFGLSAWLVAGAIGPAAFDHAQAVVLSVPGRVVLFLLTLAVFYHLCNGIRHLIWDSVRAFELRAIYTGGWAVVAASLIMTTALWLWMLK
ncbi:MAG: succinate dehydrogenase, cytochrome b556 subunit [bacterium]